jgi:hypothetical protein
MARQAVCLCAQTRRWVLVIANYLQRYCLKNDTIGFYGPVGWADAGSGAAGLAAALAVLAETFERVTGSPATRRAGENYAGRTVL